MKKIFTSMFFLSAVLVSCQDKNTKSTVPENSNPESNKEFLLSLEPEKLKKTYSIMQYIHGQYFGCTDIKLICRDENICISWSSTDFDDIATFIVYSKLFNSLAQILERNSVHLCTQNDNNASDIKPLNPEIIKAIVDYHTNQAKDDGTTVVKEHIIYEYPSPSNTKCLNENKQNQSNFETSSLEIIAREDLGTDPILFKFKYSSSYLRDTIMPYRHATAVIASKRYLNSLNQEANTEELMEIFCMILGGTSGVSIDIRRL